MVVQHPIHNLIIGEFKMKINRRTFLKLSATAITTLFVGLPTAPQKEEPSLIKTALSVEKGLWTVFRVECYAKNILFTARAVKRIVKKVKEVFA